ncbi:MAG: right-handed parallel beta-helix repeat-containing protein, partial [Gemmatimonadales bacterium]
YGEFGVLISAAQVVRVERSRFAARDDYYYYYSDGIQSSGRVLVVDSSEVVGFGYHGIAFYNGDSLHVASSRITDNGYTGIVAESYDSLTAFRAVLTRNVVRRNQYGQIGLYYPRRVRLDHNILEGEGGGGSYYDLVSFYGFGKSVVSLLGDSLRSFGGDWIYGVRYDTLLVDSAFVDVGDSYGYVQQGRRTILRNSRLTNITGQGLNVYGYNAAGAQLLVESTAVEGPAVTECDRCGYGIEVDYAHSTLTDVTFHNLYRAVYAYDSSTVVRRTAVDHAWYGFYQYCGALALDSVTVTDVAYGAVEAYGCKMSDSLGIRRSNLAAADQAVYASNLRGTIRQTMLAGGDGVVWTGATGTTARAILLDSNTVTAFETRAFNISSNDSLTSVTVRDNVAQCQAPAEYGVVVLNASPIAIERNRVTGCRYGVYVAPSSSVLPAVVPVRVAENRISLPSNGLAGVWITGARAAAAVVRDTIDGFAALAGIYVNDAGVSARVDSAVIRNTGGRGIYVLQGDTVRIRANDIVDTLPATPPCCDVRGAIQHVGGDAANVLAEIADNRVIGSRWQGIALLRNSTLDTTHVRVERNVVRGVDSLGLWIRDYAKADVFDNTLDSNGLDAMFVDRFDNDTTSVRVHNNNFTRSGRYGLQHLDAWVIHATNNWWNDPLGPGGAFGDITGASLGDSVTSNVTWDPWLTGPAPGAPLGAPPAFVAAMPAFATGMLNVSAVATSRPARPIAVRAPRALPTAVRLVPPSLPDAMQARRAEAERRRTEARPERARPEGGTP